MTGRALGFGDADGIGIPADAVVGGTNITLPQQLRAKVNLQFIIATYRFAAIGKHIKYEVRIVLGDGDGLREGLCRNDF